MNNLRTWRFCLCLFFSACQICQSASCAEAPARGSVAAARQVAAAPANSRSTTPLKDAVVDIGPYMAELSRKISKNWHAPSNPKSVEIHWKIAPDGSMSGLHVERSSGDNDNDKAAIEAVAASAPFDPLPKGVPMTAIEFSFSNAIRSGVHSVRLADQVAAQSLCNEAIELINAKKLPEGLDKLEYALDRDPNSAMVAQALRYVAAYVSDETPDNVHVLHRVLAMDPQQRAASAKLDILVRSSGHDPLAAADRLKLGEEALKRKDAEDAVAELVIANKLQKGVCPPADMVEGYRVLAAHRMGDKWRLVQKSRTDVESLCGLGRSYQLAGQFDLAEVNYKKAAELDQASDMPKGLLSKLDAERQGLEAAEKLNAPVVAQNFAKDGGSTNLLSKGMILNNEALTQMKAGDIKAAIAQLKESLAIDPSDKRVRANLSILYSNYSQKQSNADALDYLRRALYLNPTNEVARKNLSGLLQAMGKDPGAYEQRVKLADRCAHSSDYVGAVVELREAIGLKKDTDLDAKLKSYMEQAPAIP